MHGRLPSQAPAGSGLDKLEVKKEGAEQEAVTEC